MFWIARASCFKRQIVEGGNFQSNGRKYQCIYMWCAYRFPEESFKNYVIFNPKSPGFPQTEGEADFFGNDQIIQLCNRFNLPPLQTFTEWRQLLKAIVKNNPTCTNRKTSTRNFWTYYLRHHEREFIPFGANIKKLVQIILSLPIGSAEVLP